MELGNPIKSFNTLFQPMLNYCRKFEDVISNIFEYIRLQSWCIFFGTPVIVHNSSMLCEEYSESMFRFSHLLIRELIKGLSPTLKDEIKAT